MPFPNRRYPQNPNPFRPGKGASGLRRGHGSRGSRGTKYGFSTSPPNSPGRNFQRGRWTSRGDSPLFRRRNPGESEHESFDRGDFSSFKRGNRGGSENGSFHRGGSPFRRRNPGGSYPGSFHRGDSLFRRRDPGESEHRLFNRGDSSFRRRGPDGSDDQWFDREDSSFRRRNPGGNERGSFHRRGSPFRRRDHDGSKHGSFHRGDSSFRRRDPDESDDYWFVGDSWSSRTSSDESEQSLSVTLKESLSRRWIHGDFLSNKSPASSPRLHDPEAAAKEDDQLRLALAMSLEETKRKCGKSSTYEDLTLLDNMKKMSLEDPKNEEENTCVICMDKPKTHAYIPCGHRVVCAQCSKKLKTKCVLQCIICRKNANGIFQIF